MNVDQDRVSCELTRRVLRCEDVGIEAILAHTTCTIRAWLCASSAKQWHEYTMESETKGTPPLSQTLAGRRESEIEDHSTYPADRYRSQAAYSMPHTLHNPQA